MKYRLYTVVSGEENTIAESDTSLPIKREYARLYISGFLPRVSLGGRTLSISEADKWVGSMKVWRKKLRAKPERTSRTTRTVCKAAAN